MRRMEEAEVEVEPEGVVMGRNQVVLEDLCQVVLVHRFQGQAVLVLHLQG